MDARCVPAESARGDPLAQTVKYHPRQIFRRCIARAEFGQRVLILVVERLEHGFEHLARTPDIDHDIVRIELAPAELDIDNVSRAMQSLRGAESRAPERMG